jgi:hypothetical protein
MSPNRTGDTHVRWSQVSIGVFIGLVVATCQTLPCGTDIAIIGSVVAEAALGELPFFWSRVVTSEWTDERVDLIPLAVFEVVRRPVLAVGCETGHAALCGWCAG